MNNFTKTAFFSYLPFGGLINAIRGLTSKEKGNPVTNLLKHYTGTGLTESEQEQNQFNMDEAAKQRSFTEYMDNTKYQRSVQDMKDAGFNPGLMYGSAGAPSAPSGASASGSAAGVGSLSDLVNLITLPATLRRINAETKNIDANTSLTNQKKLTEEQITALQTIAVQWEPSIKAETLIQLSASIDKMQAEITDLTASAGLKVAQTDLVKSQEEAQAIVNYYLPSKTLAEINKLDADARSSEASAWFTEIQAKFARDNGFLMSSNDALLLATYIGSLFHVDKESATDFVGRVSKYIKEEFPIDFHPWRKVSPEDAIAWYLEHKD